MSHPRAHERPFLVDISRLIWRAWQRRLPTGIDRVCLAYCLHFSPQAQAFFQWRGWWVVMPPAQSDKLFAVLRTGGKAFGWKFLMLLLQSAANRRVDGKIYLNVGHTGLDSPHLLRWVARSRVKPVYLIHDLIPITHPQFCRAGEAARHTLRMKQALTSAQGLIVNSAATRVALAGFAAENGFAMPPVLIAWLGIDEAAKPPQLPPTDRPWFVVIGTIEARKNHLLLLRVWDKLVETMGDACPDLVVIGQRGWEAEDAFSLLDMARRGHGRVLELGQCDDPTRCAWLDGARALLMPSFVEGFGFPLIEALQRQVPVIASDLPVFHEIAGDIPRYCDPRDTLAWADAIAAYCDNHPDRNRQLARTATFSAPTWACHFRALEIWLRTFA